MEKDCRERQRADFPFLSDLRLNGLLGKPQAFRKHLGGCRQLCRPELPRANHCGMGGDTPSLDFLSCGCDTKTDAETGLVWKLRQSRSRLKGYYENASSSIPSDACSYIPSIKNVISFTL